MARAPSHDGARTEQQRAFLRAVFCWAGPKAAPPTRNVGPNVDIARVFSSVGSSNLVAFAQLTPSERAVVKVRAARGISAAPEAWGLRHAAKAAMRTPDALLVPELYFITTSAQRFEYANAGNDLAALRVLDADFGDALCTAFLPGPAPAPTMDNAARIGRAAAALHALRPKVGPSLRTASHPRRLIAWAQDLVRELGASNVLSKAAHKDLVAAGKKAVSRVDLRAERVRTLCHGDLRWHNAIVPEGSEHDANAPIALFDFEHAGIGDPVLDLAFFVARGDLSDNQTLALLDAYDAARVGDKTFSERFFGLLPLCRLLSALFGAGDLLRVRDGRRATVQPAADFITARKAGSASDLGEAVARLLDGLPPRGQRPTPRHPFAFKLPALKKARAAVTKAKRVTVDGTAGSGKSVLAARAALLLDAPHINVGAAYRVITLHALSEGLSPKRAPDVDALCAALDDNPVTLHDDGAASWGAHRYHHALALWSIEGVVDRFAALDPVRDRVDAAVAHALKRKRRYVLEGRCAGTVYAPEADTKIFIDADVAVRAARVASRLGVKKSIATVETALTRRDDADRSRTRAPLVRPTGAVRIDTTKDALAASAARIERIVRGVSKGAR